MSWAAISKAQKSIIREPANIHRLNVKRQDVQKTSLSISSSTHPLKTQREKLLVSANNDGETEVRTTKLRSFKDAFQVTEHEPRTLKVGVELWIFCLLYKRMDAACSLSPSFYTLQICGCVAWPRLSTLTAMSRRFYFGNGTVNRSEHSCFNDISVLCLVLCVWGLVQFKSGHWTVTTPLLHHS